MKFNISLQALLLLLIPPSGAWASWSTIEPISIVSGNSQAGEVEIGGTYLESFNTVDISGYTSFPSAAWWNAGGGGSLTIGPGSQAQGVSLNLGLDGDSDRAIGVVQGYFGVSFINSSDSLITGVGLTFDGEEWTRFDNNPQRSDVLYFQSRLSSY